MDDYKRFEFRCENNNCVLAINKTPTYRVCIALNERPKRECRFCKTRHQMWVEENRAEEKHGTKRRFTKREDFEK